MERPHPASGPAAGPRAGWHYRDARGRDCGPYDDASLIHLFRFGHVHPDSPVREAGDDDAPVPLRQRRDRFRLHADGRLEILPVPAQVPEARRPAGDADAGGADAGHARQAEPPAAAPAPAAPAPAASTPASPAPPDPATIEPPTSPAAPPPVALSPEARLADHAPTEPPAPAPRWWPRMALAAALLAVAAALVAWLAS